MRMLEPEERAALEMIQRTDYSVPKWPGHPAFDEATPTDASVFDRLHRFGRIIWTEGKSLGNGWVQSDPVVTAMGVKALRIDALIRGGGP